MWGLSTCRLHCTCGTSQRSITTVVFQRNTVGFFLLLGQLQCDDAFWLCLHTLPPELEFGVDGPVKHKVILQTLSVEGADWRMMAHLL